GAEGRPGEGEGRAVRTAPRAALRREAGFGRGLIAVLREDGGDLPDGARLAEAVVGGDVGRRGADGAVLDHLEPQLELFGLGPQAVAAEDEDGGMDGDGGLGLGDAAPG